MRFQIILFLIFLFSKGALGQDTYVSIPLSNSAKDSSLVMEQTRVVDIRFLSKDEQAVIQWINIARMYPKWYVRFRKLKDTDPVYTRTLIKTLNRMKPLRKKLVPSKKLWLCAACHSKSTVGTGYMGHTRQNSACKITYNSECIHYGNSNPAEAVESLLTDRNVPDLGHRIAILNPDFNYIGVSMMLFDKNRKTNIVVIDFGI